MSAPRGALLNTPGKAGTSRTKSQSANDQYKQDEVKGELEVDLKAAKECGFDELVRHFFYLILEDSQEKKDLDDWQKKIEGMQSQRYYPPEKPKEKKNEDSQQDGAGQAPEDDEEPEETGRLGEGTEDDKYRSEDERKLIKQRDNLLNQLLDRAMAEVLPFANDATVKQFLVDFEAKLKSSNEPERYVPYVELCNRALRLLFNAGQNLPVRKADALDIRFQVNHPHVIGSHYSGAQKVNRKPDVIVSSRVALTGSCFTEQWPAVGWTSVLSCHEFKIKSVKNPHGIMDGLQDHVYQAGQLADLTPHAMLPVLDTVGDTEDAASSKRSRSAAGLDDQQGQPSKRKRASQGRSAGSKGKPRTKSGAQAKVEGKQESKDEVEARVQCASYALEMLSYSVGVHHAINILFTDGTFWVWYYDRQGVLQSKGVSIFKDLPRFILLLFIFQRFTLKDWGIVPDLNPGAVAAHKGPPATSVSNVEGKKAESDIKKDARAPPVFFAINILKNLQEFPNFRQENAPVVKLSDVELNMNEYLSYKPHCLAGRATAVVASTGTMKSTKQRLSMVCKLYHPEYRRRNEGLTMKVIYRIVEDDMSLAQQDTARKNLGIESMAKYLPQFYFCGDVMGTSTHRIRSMVNCRWKGHRVMRIIGMKELKKITTVTGWKFTKAWFDGLLCHAFLWKNHIEHGDPSLSNLMYDEETECGVLTDFDLSLLQWEPRVFGTDRTGTIPFMALDLLTPRYWDGKFKRYYHHELEAFIWILCYVFLLYQNSERQTHRKVDLWRTSSYEACHEKKSSFLTDFAVTDDIEDFDIKADFKDCWPVADDLLLALIDQRSVAARRRRHPQGTPQTRVIPEELQDAADLWQRVSDALQQRLKDRQEANFGPLLACFQYFKPDFELSDDEVKTLRNKFKGILGAVPASDNIPVVLEEPIEAILN